MLSFLQVFRRSPTKENVSPCFRLYHLFPSLSSAFGSFFESDQCLKRRAYQVRPPAHARTYKKEPPPRMAVGLALRLCDPSWSRVSWCHYYNTTWELCQELRRKKERSGEGREGGYSPFSHSPRRVQKSPLRSSTLFHRSGSNALRREKLRSYRNSPSASKG